MPRFFLLSLGVLILSASTSAQSISFGLSAQNIIQIPAELEGDTITLMLHTGHSGISITETAANRIYGDESGLSYESESWGGAGQGRVLQHKSMDLADFHWDSLEVWVDKQTGAGTEGKIGLDQFESRWISIDYDAQTLTLSSEQPSGLKEEEALSLRHDRSILFVEASLEIGGQPYPHEFMIHSGYNGSIMLDDEFASAQALADKLEIVSSQDMMDAAGNKLSSTKTRGANFLVGTERLEDVEVSFFTGSIGRMQISLLGSEILSAFNPVIDLEEKRIWLRPRER